MSAGVNMTLILTSNASGQHEHMPPHETNGGEGFVAF